jgi:uncharacterized protein (TIGR03083 family)
VDFRAELLAQTRDFGELIRSGDPTTPVPSCPEWTLQQLFRHVGRGNRWAAQIIDERRDRPLDPREVRNGKPPDDIDGAIAWLEESSQLILDAVDHVGNGRVWTFIGPRPAGWWIRRRLHEVTVHHADAALALGVDFALDPEVAADAISEWIELIANEKPGALDRGRTLHLHATDAALGPTGEWTVVHDEDGLWWSHNHGKGDVALRGSVNDLLLAITRRRTAGDLGVETFGDIDVWDGWLQRTPF